MQKRVTVQMYGFKSLQAAKRARTSTPAGPPSADAATGSAPNLQRPGTVCDLDNADQPAAGAYISAVWDGIAAAEAVAAAAAATSTPRTVVTPGAEAAAFNPEQRVKIARDVLDFDYKAETLGAAELPARPLMRGSIEAALSCGCQYNLMGARCTGARAAIGAGAFAAEDIPENKAVVEIVGELRSAEELHEHGAGQHRGYLVLLPTAAGAALPGAKVAIDIFKRANISRLVNSACSETNVVITPVHLPRGPPRLVFTTTRHIGKNEELLYDALSSCGSDKFSREQIEQAAAHPERGLIKCLCKRRFCRGLTV